MATNVKSEIKGDILTITVDVSKATRDAAQPSSTGKTKTVASTHGFDWGTGIPGLGFSLTVSAK